MTFDEPAPSPAFLELADSPASELAARMATGTRPDPGALAGFEYRGLNTSVWLRTVGADRFVKGFAADRGYNRRVRRGPRTEPWLPREGPEPVPFAFFRLAAVDPAGPSNRYPNAVLLDYGAFAKLPIDPVGRIRDYLVALDAGHDLLLGHAFLAVGTFRPALTFFVLERLRAAPATSEPGDQRSE